MQYRVGFEGWGGVGGLDWKIQGSLGVFFKKKLFILYWGIAD